MITSEGAHPFTECATYADEIKESWGGFQSPWHFINQPYLPDDGTTVDDFPEFNPPSVNIVDCLSDLYELLKTGQASADSPYIKAISEQFPDLDDQKSFALRLIIHYLGDIHQPLHTVAEVDSEYPKGDEGGNLEKVPSDEGVENLHGIWDSIVY